MKNKALAELLKGLVGPLGKEAVDAAFQAGWPAEMSLKRGSEKVLIRIESEDDRLARKPRARLRVEIAGRESGSEYNMRVEFQCKWERNRA